MEKDNINIMIKMQNIYAFHLFFVVKGDLARKIDQFKFIIVTLLNGNCKLLIGELHSQFQTSFFKHEKIQMKQISDKVNLAVRRCKNKGKKITAAEARDYTYLDKLVKLDEGYYIFRQLRNSPAYLEARKKDIFAMIRQLSLPAWFMSLSAADTRWTYLLRMLAKLNGGIVYLEKEVDDSTWQEKTNLVQNDPVTCSRNFDHRVQEFLNTVLKSARDPVGNVKHFFYSVEFQQRGSPHIHMLVLIENAPTLENNSEEFSLLINT